MDARIALARLASGVVNYDDLTGSSVPGMGLTAHDVAGAMAMGRADPATVDAVRARWVQDRSAQNSLFYRVYDEVVSLAAYRKWSVPTGKELLRKLTRLAILEFVSPGLCGRCSGRGWLYPPGKVPRACPACGGTGHRAMSERRRAELVGIPPSTWDRTWKHRYPKVKELISRKDRAGLYALTSGLAD